MMLSPELMRDRIASLKKANEAATKRRQRKKKRIQKFGVLTKGAGEDLLAQHEADQQITHKSVKEESDCNGAGKTTRISIGSSVTQRHMGVRGTANEP
ncbi:hypothetical protein KJE20_14334 [Pyrenophora tritici-repentis]|nr:hypothetical protein KJE20_14334 [Pyrenophora tritici-repentis]